MSDVSLPLSNAAIGFIGLGLMGKPMARNLHKAGAMMTVHNRSKPALETLAAEGMSPAVSPAELASQVGDGVIILMLTDSPATEMVFRGTDGLIDALAPGALIIDMGTNGIAETREWAAAASHANAHWLDAPVSGGEVGAIAGSLSIMAGGDSAVFERAKPVLQVLGDHITYIGPSGAGQVAKIANQMIVAQTIAAVAEALTLAERSGANIEAVRQALLGGFASSRILDLHGQRMIKQAFEPGGRATAQLKDVREAVRLAESQQLNLPQLATNHELWEKMIDRGYGDLDHSGLYHLYQSTTGFTDSPQN